ncbi:MAG: hypothetical protein II822_02610 [Prevotella sp.]|nr:hypothetical protein [Prevotella sp.]
MKKTNLLKLALCAMTLLPTAAWADDIDKVSQMTMTWKFDQFAHNDIALQNPAGASASLYLDGLYLAVESNATAGARKFTASRVVVDAITKSANCTDDDVTASGFTTGDYMALTADRPGTVRFNTAPNKGTGYAAFGFRVNNAGTIYALVKGTSKSGQSRTVALYDCGSYTGHTSATKLDEVTPDEKYNTTYYLLKGEAIANGIYQIMSTVNGACTVLAIKFVPASEAGGKRSLTVSLTNGMATYSSSYETAVPSGVKAYIASAIAGGKVTMTEVTTIPANTGVILKADDSETTSVTLKNKVTSDYTLPADNKMIANIGAYELPKTGKDKTAATYNNYILVKSGSDIVFAPVSGTGKVGANKAYLHLTDAEVASLSEAHALTLDFVESGDVTGVSEVRGQKEEVRDYYNLSGQRVSQPTKGLYIVNGRKVIVK